MNMKFYTCVAIGLKLKVRKFWGLIPMFVEVTGVKLEPRVTSFAEIIKNATMFTKTTFEDSTKNSKI